MNESLLNALIKLFAIISDVKHFKNPNIARQVIEKYILQNYGKSHAQKSKQYFNDHLKEYHQNLPQNRKADVAVYNSRIEEICSEINKEFEQRQKFWLYLQLLEFLSDSDYDSEEEVELVRKIAYLFKIDKDDFEQSRAFILSTNDFIPLTDKTLVISSEKNFSHPKAKQLYNEKLIGEIYVLHLKSSNIYLFKYLNDYNLFLNGLNITANRVYIWGIGAVIRGRRIGQVYYGRMVSAFTTRPDTKKINFQATNVSYNFINSENGIKPFDLEARSGQLIGIVGGSGSGKSTLLNVLNGNLTQKTGDLTINGYDIHKDKDEINGIIGYVPQEDLLFEELTVYQNLYYNAKLCFSHYSEEEIDQIVTKAINNFDLKEAKDLKVGDPINKILSGGQRKRLNIALELMREPALLFVDEPTSGLSSMDSEKILNLLKRQTFKEKLVILTIHQPSSDLYKLFDRIIVVDQGGRIIFSGNPLDAIAYFRKQANFVNPDDSECTACGNVNSEQILQIIESRVVNEFGKLSRKRKRQPDEWEEVYKKSRSAKIANRKIKKEKLPDNNFNKPSKYKQFKIFFKRNLESKLSNRQYILLILLEAPLLAIILGLFTKDFNGPENLPDLYIFSNNENLPAYIFMSIIVALFLGMIISAEEIIRDKKIIKRESFLNLSRWSYINSKTLYLMLISGIQSILFILIGNSILEINGLTFSYWLMIFTTAVCANLIGLNISAAFNTVVSCYITIPFILVPQLLLSGVVVDYNKIHKSIKSVNYTPIYGDLMTSRWAYEGLVVEQFKNNRFQKNFYDIEKELSKTNYLVSYYIQKLQTTFVELSVLSPSDSSINAQEKIQLLENELYKLSNEVSDYTFQDLAKGLASGYTNEKYQELFTNKLEYLKTKLFNNEDIYKQEKEEIYAKMLKKLGGSEAFGDFQQNYHNQGIADLVLNNLSYKKITVDDGMIIQLKDPIYRHPDSGFGRAHFFSPIKKIGNIAIETYWFNLIVIWTMSIIMYFLLQFDLIRKGLVYLESIRVTKGWSKKVLRV